MAFFVGDNYALLLRRIGSGPFGSFSFSYHYRYKKWFWYGVNLYVLPYKNFQSQIYYTNYIYYNSNFTSIALTPSVRFSYVNSTYSTLYSALAIGAGVNLNGSIKDLIPFMSPFYQITLFGFSFGKNLFAGGEIGRGYSTSLVFFKCGYRFR